MLDNKFYQSATAYIIYKDSFFFKRGFFGVKPVPDYENEIRDISNHRFLESRTTRRKKVRFWTFVEIEGQKDVIPNWGLIAGNISSKDYDQDEVNFILDQDYVECVIFTLEDQVYHVAYKNKNVFYV